MLFVLETKPMPGSRRLRDTEREKEGERGKEQGEQGIGEMGKLKRGGGRVQQVHRRGTGAEGRRERADSWESKRELSRDSQLKDRDCESDTDAVRGRGESIELHASQLGAPPSGSLCFPSMQAPLGECKGDLGVPHLDLLGTCEL